MVILTLPLAIDVNKRISQSDARTTEKEVKSYPYLQLHGLWFRRLGERLSNKVKSCGERNRNGLSLLSCAAMKIQDDSASRGSDVDIY